MQLWSGASDNLLVGQKVGGRAGGWTPFSHFVSVLLHRQADPRSPFPSQVYAIGNPFGLDHTLTQVSCMAA